MPGQIPFLAETLAQRRANLCLLEDGRFDWKGRASGFPPPLSLTSTGSA